MKKITIFLASSSELKAEREKFIIEIYSKTKQWFKDNIFLDLIFWEDMSAGMAAGGSQHEYNEAIRTADLFVLLVHTKMGDFSAEEFTIATGHFSETKKPFIFTYFKDTVDTDVLAPSLELFKTRLREMKHYISHYKDINDLWNQFNKELERVKDASFEKNVRTDAGASVTNNATTDSNNMTNSNNNSSNSNNTTTNTTTNNTNSNNTNNNTTNNNNNTNNTFSGDITTFTQNG